MCFCFYVNLMASRMIVGARVNQTADCTRERERERERESALIGDSVNYS